MIAGHSSGSFVLRYCLTYSIVRCGLNQSSTVGTSLPRRRRSFRRLDVLAGSDLQFANVLVSEDKSRGGCLSDTPSSVASPKKRNEKGKEGRGPTTRSGPTGPRSGRGTPRRPRWQRACHTSEGSGTWNAPLVGAAAPAPSAGSREVIPPRARIGHIHVAAAPASRRTIASPEGPLRGIGGTEAANPKRGRDDAYADTAVATLRRPTTWTGGRRRSTDLPL